MELRQVKAIVRTACVQNLIGALRGAEVTRFHVSRVHALGAGVDPTDMRPSLDEGSTYTEKARLEFYCRAERVGDLVDLIRSHAGTGHRGDGVVIVSPVTDIVGVRTGDHAHAALL